MQSDLELLSKAKAGDAGAFRQLVERHEQLVRSTVGGMMGWDEEADDVAQQVFIRFYRSMDQFEGKSKLGTYLTRIAINLSINALKRRQKLQRRVVPLHQVEKIQEVSDASADPVRAEMRQMIQQALQELEPEFRSVIILRLIDGFSVQETAEILHLPKGTVASRLSRAQKKLKDILFKWKVI